MAEILKLLKKRQFAAAGYLTGWKIVGFLPEKLAGRLFEFGADRASDHGRGMGQLRLNLSRVVSPQHVTRRLVQESVRSYARYWMEAFRLPRLVKDEKLLARLSEGVVGRELFEASFYQGKGVVLTLPHSGNWDMAGLWLVNNYGQFTTVAERLKPEELFEAFVEYREKLGFEVLALSGGQQPPFDRLAEVLRNGGIVCLLGERDLKQTGLEVEFFNETTTMPVGAVKLALDTGAALHVVHSWFYDDERGPGWGLKANPAIGHTDIKTMLQQVADEFAENIKAHPQDWHMLQPLWPADVQKRRERRQAKKNKQANPGRRQ